MAIYDNYRIRFNTALNALQMNVGGEDWELVPLGIIPGDIALADGKLLVGNASNMAAQVTLSGAGTVSNTGVLSLTSTSVTGALLTGYVSGAGTVASTDTILQGINKLNGNAAAISTVANGALQRSGGTMTGGFFIADFGPTRGLLQFGAGATLLDGDTNTLSFTVGSGQRWIMVGNGVLEGVAGASLNFLSGGFGTGVNAAIASPNADILEVNNGTVGAFRDIQVRNVHISDTIAIGNNTLSLTAGNLILDSNSGEGDFGANGDMFIYSNFSGNGRPYLGLYSPASGNYTSLGSSNAVSIGQDTAPDASAVLDVHSDSLGFLPPRMTTTQRAAITSPAAGLMV